jgi:hypothetical protein
MYKKRSDFVHEGILDNIDNEDILFMRQCVRESLLKMLSDNKKKKVRVLDLKKLLRILSNGIHNGITITGILFQPCHI